MFYNLLLLLLLHIKNAYGQMTYYDNLNQFSSNNFGYPFSQYQGLPSLFPTNNPYFSQSVIPAAGQSGMPQLVFLQDPNYLNQQNNDLIRQLYNNYKDTSTGLPNKQAVEQKIIPTQQAAPVPTETTTLKPVAPNPKLPVDTTPNFDKPLSESDSFQDAADEHLFIDGLGSINIPSQSTIDEICKAVDLMNTNKANNDSSATDESKETTTEIVTERITTSKPKAKRIRKARVVTTTETVPEVEAKKLLNEEIVSEATTIKTVAKDNLSISNNSSEKIITSLLISKVNNSVATTSSSAETMKSIPISRGGRCGKKSVKRKI